MKLLILVAITIFSIFIYEQAFASHIPIPIPKDDHEPGMRTVIDWYVPRSHSVNVGDVVTWTNEDPAPHTVTSGNGMLYSKYLRGETVGTPNGIFDSGIINPGESWSYTFSEVGVFPYFCTLHPWVERTITVVDSGKDVPSPKKQLSEGVQPYDVQCKPEYSLIFKTHNQKPVCVKSESTDRLISLGWALSYDPFPKIIEASKFEQVMVTLQGEDRVSEILSDQKLEAGPKMTYLSVSLDGGILLASSSGSDTVHAFDMIKGEKISSVSVGKTPKGVKINHDGKIAFVANENSGTVSVLDMTNLQLIKEIEIGKIPHNIVFHPNGLIAYVTIQGEDEIAIVDVRELEKIDTIPIGSLPHNLDITPDGQRLFVTNIGTNDVSVIDLSTKDLIKKIPVSKGHHGIDIPPFGDRVFVSGIGDDKVSVIDATSLEVISQIVVGQGPHGLRTDFHSNKLYVGVTQTNEIVVIDTMNLEIVERVYAGNNPFWIAVAGNP